MKKQKWRCGFIAPGCSRASTDEVPRVALMAFLGTVFLPDIKGNWYRKKGSNGKTSLIRWADMMKCPYAVDHFAVDRYMPVGFPLLLFYLTYFNSGKKITVVR